jgi:hypothetical protein
VQNGDVTTLKSSLDKDDGNAITVVEVTTVDKLYHKSRGEMKGTNQTQDAVESINPLVPNDTHTLFGGSGSNRYDYYYNQYEVRRSNHHRNISRRHHHSNNEQDGIIISSESTAAIEL